MGTGLIEKPTEGQIAAWQRCHTIIRRNAESVREWLDAVLEIKQDCLYQIRHATWQEFCEKDLGMAASTVWRKLQAGQSAVQTKPELPSFSESDPIQQGRHCEPLARSLKTMVKQYVTLTAQWPQDAKLKAMDKKLISACGGLAVWLDDYCETPEVERMIGNRKS